MEAAPGMHESTPQRRLCPILKVEALICSVYSSLGKAVDTMQAVSGNMLLGVDRRTHCACSIRGSAAGNQLHAESQKFPPKRALELCCTQSTGSQVNTALLCTALARFPLCRVLRVIARAPLSWRYRTVKGALEAHAFEGDAITQRATSRSSGPFMPRNRYTRWSVSRLCQGRTCGVELYQESAGTDFYASRR